MTKLTIQLDWVKYISKNNYTNMYMKIMEWIGMWDLELQPQEEKTEETILQKLRAELKELIKWIWEPPTRFQEWRLCGYKESLSLINELEKVTQRKEYYYRDKYWNPIELELAKSWQPFSQVPIEKIPEFDYKKICGKYSGQKFPEAKALIEYWEQIQQLTTTVNKLIERFNNK